jgi:predicted DNA-binding protein with PD1-like motif
VLSSEKNSFLVFRLNPDEDLKKAINNICLDKKIKAACVVSVVGSLKNVNIRLANSNEFLKIDEKFEVLSLQGLISEAGIHLHISISNSKGQVFGGHLMDGNIVFTTCEVVLLLMNDLIFNRELDSKTGFKELKISR